MSEKELHHVQSLALVRMLGSKNLAVQSQDWIQARHASLPQAACGFRETADGQAGEEFFIVKAN